MELTGMKFGKLTVRNKVKIDKRKWQEVRNQTWRCKCECGEIKDFLESNLLSGRTKSCGCSRRDRGKDLTGERFGRLVVKRLVKHDGKGRKWWAKCDCGRDAEVFQANLTQGRTRSCGCLKRELAAERLSTHPIHPDHRKPIEPRPMIMKF